MKICLDCSEAGRPRGSGTILCDRCYKNRQRNRNKGRATLGLYNKEWQKESRAAREATPWCSVCFNTLDLTLDHETNTVQCRSCNAKHRGTTVKDDNAERRTKNQRGGN